MYGATILQATDARPTLRSVTPLYQKSVLRGKLNSMLAVLAGRSSGLGDISQLTGGRRVHSQRSLGAKVVRIAEIQASEDRSGDFDRGFNPLEIHTKSRWLSIAAARLNGQAMPAVELIKVGDAYAVRDGHHRISVARALGEDFIDACVTEWDLAS
jgi:hypothetical protein